MTFSTVVLQWKHVFAVHSRWRKPFPVHSKTSCSWLLQLPHIRHLTPLFQICCCLTVRLLSGLIWKELFLLWGEITIVQSFKNWRSITFYQIKVIIVFNYRWACFLFFVFNSKFIICVLWKRGFVLGSSRTSGKGVLSHWQWFLRFPGRIFDFRKPF